MTQDSVPNHCQESPVGPNLPWWRATEPCHCWLVHSFMFSHIHSFIHWSICLYLVMVYLELSAYQVPLQALETPWKHSPVRELTVEWGHRL